MSNQTVKITARDDSKQSATVYLTNTRLNFYANPTQAEPAPTSGTMRFPAQFHIDKDAPGAKEFIEMLRAFRKSQNHSEDNPVRWCVEDGDRNINPETGEAWPSSKNTYIIGAYRQESGQGKGLVFAKSSLKAGQSVPPGWTQKGNSIVKMLTNSSEIGGNDIVNMEINIYKPKKLAGVFASWNFIQLVNRVGRGGGSTFTDFDSLPDSDVELPEIDFSGYGGTPEKPEDFDDVPDFAPAGKTPF